MQHYCYAQLNEQLIAFAKTQTHSEIAAPNMIAVSADDDVLGKRWDGEQWHEVAPTPPAATVAITSITADAEHAAATHVTADLKSVDTSTGATLTFAAELRDSDEAVLPVDQVFRMPLVAADGGNDRRLIRVAFEHGVASFSVTLSTSRHWRVDEAAINQNLQPHERLAFAGLDVYVLE